MFSNRFSNPSFPYGLLPPSRTPPSNCFFQLGTTSVAIFSQSTLRSRHLWPSSRPRKFPPSVATCLAFPAMAPKADIAEAQKTQFFSAVQDGDHRKIYQHYMRMGDPAAALLWAVLRNR